MSVDRAQISAYNKLRRAKWNRKHERWAIRLQWRAPLKEGGDPQDWRNWRTFACVPILFHTEQDAWNYMEMVDIFKNLRNMVRKPSASVDRVVI